MRIISGQFRGRKLFTPGQSNLIRPTADRAREALFSIIGDKVLSARVLDLYAGTGALGLESLSRGAMQAVFIDKNHKALQLIKKNCNLCLQGKNTDSDNKAVIIKHDLSRGMNLQLNESFGENPFDLIFLDPPYENGLADKSLAAIDTSDIFNSNTLVVAEECSGVTLPQCYEHLELSNKRRYGDTSFWFYRVKSS